MFWTVIVIVEGWPLDLLQCYDFKVLPELEWVKREPEAWLNFISLNLLTELLFFWNTQFIFSSLDQFFPLPEVSLLGLHTEYSAG